MPFGQIRRGGAWLPLSVQGNSGLFIIGAVEPVADTNTGPNGIWAADKKLQSLLTPMYGDQVFNTPGQTIVNRDIFGFVTITAPNITLSGCKVRGYVTGTLPGGATTHPATTSTGLVNTNNANCTNATVQDCELIPDNPNQYVDAIYARRYRAYRNNIQNCVDGLGAFDTSSAHNADIKAYGNFIDNHAWFFPAAGHSDGSHCDGIQQQGDDNVDFQGNRVTGLINPNIAGFTVANYYAQKGDHGLARGIYPANAALQFNENTHKITTGCIYNKNWLGGGDLETVNMYLNDAHFDSFDNNIFDLGTNGSGKAWAFATRTGTTFGHTPVGNKFRDGTLVVIKFQA